MDASEYLEPDGDGTFCECCPHAVRSAETLATLMHHLEQALHRQNASTEAMRKSCELIDRLRSERDEQELMIEQFAIEVYELKGKLAAAQQRTSKLCEQAALTARFLSALGYSHRMPAEGVDPPS